MSSGNALAKNDMQASTAKCCVLKSIAIMLRRVGDVRDGLLRCRPLDVERE